MIVAARKEKDVINKFDRFGEAMPDGRLTMPSEGKIYRLREAILLSKKLGRPLSEEEMRQFEVSYEWLETTRLFGSFLTFQVLAREYISK